LTRYIQKMICCSGYCSSLVHIALDEGQGSPVARLVGKLDPYLLSGSDVDLTLVMLRRFDMPTSLEPISTSFESQSPEHSVYRARWQT